MPPPCGDGDNKQIASLSHSFSDSVSVLLHQGCIQILWWSVRCQFQQQSRMVDDRGCNSMYIRAVLCDMILYNK